MATTTPAKAAATDESDPKWKKQEEALCAQYKKKIILKKVDVKEPQVIDAVRIAVECLDKDQKETDVAFAIKQHFDATHGPKTWHVCVGRKYGSHVTHEHGGFLYFNVSRTAILVFLASSK